MVSGAVVTERIFRWPGVGQLAVEAVLNRDGPVIFGTVLFSAAAVVVATFTLDIVDVLLDPRLRCAERAPQLLRAPSRRSASVSVLSYASLGLPSLGSLATLGSALCYVKMRGARRPWRISRACGASGGAERF